MEAETIDGTITAISALIVAIISLISALLSNRQSSKSLKEIESLKHNLSERSSKNKYRDNQIIETLKSLRSIVQSIQILKDKLQIVLTAFEDSLDSNSAVSMIEKSRERLFEEYEINLSNLDESEKITSHNAKNKALNIENLIKNRLSNIDNVSDLSEKDKSVIREERQLLTELQQNLRDKINEKTLLLIGCENEY